MEIVVGKTGSYTICFDTVQWGIAQEKGNINFFAKPTKKDKPENAISFDNIKAHSNIVIFKDGEVNRLTIKDKKAKSIPGAKKRASDSLKDRLNEEFGKKYGQRESASR